MNHNEAFTVFEIDEKSGRVVELLVQPSDNPAARFTTEVYLEFVAKTLSDLQVLIKAKNQDYTNGAGPFANFDQAADFGVDPFHGLMLRMGDKFQRIKSYCKQGKLEVANEGVEDALKDLIGYSLIGLALLDEKRRGAR
jgi:Nucleotide modification associated domain 1